MLLRALSGGTSSIVACEEKSWRRQGQGCGIQIAQVRAAGLQAMGCGSTSRMTRSNQTEAVWGKVWGDSSSPVNWCR